MDDEKVSGNGSAADTGSEDGDGPAAWDGVLRDMAGRLDALDGALGGGGALPGAFELPPGLGPLPAALRTRAEALLLATRTMERRVADERQVLAVRLAVDAERGATPIYVDTRA